jgi:hypothetical protein
MLYLWLILNLKNTDHIKQLKSVHHKCILFVNIGKYSYMLRTYYVLYDCTHDDTIPVFNGK